MTFQQDKAEHKKTDRITLTFRGSGVKIGYKTSYKYFGLKEYHVLRSIVRTTKRTDNWWDRTVRGSNLWGENREYSRSQGESIENKDSTIGKGIVAVP